MATAGFADQPDGAQVNTCLSGENVESGIGRVHNRFTYCRRIPLRTEYWEVGGDGVPVEKEGETRAKLEVFAAGDSTERRTRVWARITPGSVAYDWGAIDNIFVAPHVQLALIGQCSQSTAVCHATRGPATLSWSIWNNNTGWFYWDVYGHEDIGEGRDKISYHQWYVEARTNSGDYRTLVPGRTPARLVRCDSATYFTLGNARYPKACVFSETTPRLTYSLDSDYQAAAFHIYTAQFHPNSTYPLLAAANVPPPRDKRIPGRYDRSDPDAAGLHRITEALHPDQYARNAEHKAGACYKTGPYADEYLDTGLPVRPKSPLEVCDEYPPATTLEGAGHPYWDFSVKAIPQSENSIADALLRTYYVNDRMLAWDASLDRPDEVNDRFYLEIP